MLGTYAEKSVVNALSNRVNTLETNLGKKADKSALKTIEDQISALDNTDKLTELETKVTKNTEDIAKKADEDHTHESGSADDAA